MTAKTEFLLARQALCDAAVAWNEVRRGATMGDIAEAAMNLNRASTRYAEAVRATGLGAPVPTVAEAIATIPPVWPRYVTAVSDPRD